MAKIIFDGVNILTHFFTWMNIYWLLKIYLKMLQVGICWQIITFAMLGKVHFIPIFTKSIVLSQHLGKIIKCFWQYACWSQCYHCYLYIHKLFIVDTCLKCLIHREYQSGSHLWQFVHWETIIGTLRYVHVMNIFSHGESLLRNVNAFLKSKVYYPLLPDLFSIIECSEIPCVFEDTVVTTIMIIVCKETRRDVWWMKFDCCLLFTILTQVFDPTQYIKEPH